ncbi:hypothetical protein LWI28_020723 [Acer negundo]|uniref:Uncharacterized protein n=1 Tax=Acer negundo TaxID=4023 RepID=A0AAD5IGD2_ACENE|nr:hypothetical protein LWI28_020723 [Acer negundo]
MATPSSSSSSSSKGWTSNITSIAARVYFFLILLSLRASFFSVASKFIVSVLLLLNSTQLQKEIKFSIGIKRCIKEEEQNGTAEKVKKIIMMLNEAEVPSEDVVGMSLFAQRGRVKEEEFVKKVQEMMHVEEKQQIPIAQSLPWTTDEPEVSLLLTT